MSSRPEAAYRPAPSVTEASRPRGILFRAAPDDGQVTVRLDTLGHPAITWPNRLKLPAAVERRLEGEAEEVWLNGPREAALRTAPWIINTCADADDYARALDRLDRVAGPDRPVLNHPRAVALTRRDLSALRLAGVPGLSVPRVLRFTPRTRDAAERAFAASGFRLPVLVRPSRGQTGRGLVRVDSPEDFARAVASARYGQPHFMTEFVDFATAEGLYLKARVVFVGGQAFLRHVKAGAGWKVHNQTPDRLKDFGHREIEVIEALEADPAFGALCAAVAARTGLDFAGMDLGVDPERGRYTLFECNPAMSIFFKVRPDQSAADRARREKVVVPLERAISALVRDPGGWGGALPQGKAGVTLPPVCDSLG